MAYHDDLIEHAIFLADLNLAGNPKQVDLRRAVSAAYYAVFHLLTTEAALNWGNPNQRSRFARVFDHGRMKNCSSKVLARALPVDPTAIKIAADLRVVADSFVKLQQARHTADYDNSKVWSWTEVFETIAQAREAITAWMVIRQTEMAQDYLLDLMATR